MLACLVFLVHQVLKAPKVNLEMVGKLVQEEAEEQWDLLAEMESVVEQVVMESVEEVVPLEPKENKDTLECQGCLVPKDISVCQVSQVSLVLMDLLESLERMDLRDNQVPKVIWAPVDFWDPEVSQVLLVSQVFQDWKEQKVQKAPWDLWVGLVILELQDHLDPLVLQVLKDLLVPRVCQVLLASQVFLASQVLMVCQVSQEQQDPQVKKENQVPLDLKEFLDTLVLEV